MTAFQEQSDKKETSTGPRYQKIYQFFLNNAMQYKNGYCIWPIGDMDIVPHRF